MVWTQSPAFLADFGGAQGWTSPKFKRVVQDIDQNAGQTLDYVGFGSDHVTIAWGGIAAGPLNSKGSGFTEVSPDSFQIHDFGTVQGYDNTYLRGVDFTGPIDATVWASGNAGLYYYKEVGETPHTDAGGHTFFVPNYQGPFFINDFGHNQGWDTTHGINVVFAKNTDATASILGFGDNGLVVDRQAFGAVPNTATYTVPVAVGNIAGGYNNVFDIRTFQDYKHHTIDLNADGYADFVGFGPQGTQIAFGGADGAGNYILSNPTTVNFGSGADFGDAQGWNNQNSVRDLIDVNADGKLDIVAFGFDGVHVALGTGGGFGAEYKASSDFGIQQGWNTTDHLRLLGDVNGDSITDIVAFGANTTFLVLGAKDGTGKVTWDASQVLDPSHQLHDLTKAQGWSTTDHVRIVGDVNGDGHADIVATGAFGTGVWSFA